MREILFILVGIILVYIFGYIVYVNLKNRREQRYINEGRELASRIPDDDGTVGQVRKMARSEIREEPAFNANSVQSTPKEAIAQVKTPVEKIWSSYYQFNIVSRDHKPFTFDQLKTVFRDHGMVYGKFDILYYYDKQNPSIELFRIGSMIKPGTFPKGITGQGPAEISWSTKGICVIMFLAESGKAEARFNNILGHINSISSSLDGLLCTKNLSPLTDNVIDEYRKQLYAYDHQ